MGEGLRRLRWRTTVVATVAVALALGAVSVAIVAFVSRSLVAAVHDEALARVEQVIERLDAGDKTPVPIDPEDEWIHVFGPNETVVAPPLEDVSLEVSRVVSLPDSSDVTIVVARSLGDVAEARGTVIRGLAIGVPAVLVVVALVTWWIAGVTVRPVERAQERQRRFVADAAHELRSPVAAIRQHAEVAVEHPGSTDISVLGTAVRDEALRLQALVEDLLLLARFDEGAVSLSLEEVDLDDLLRAEAARLRSLFAASVDTTAVGAGRVRGDARYLERVVRNLGDNAARHARHRVGFSLDARAETVTFAVDDDGPGIPAEDRERVFDRFERVDAARGRETGGTGLGLAIVREIVATHHGVVTLDASRLGGLRAEVRLPAATDQTVG